MKQSVMLLDGAIRIRAEHRPIACGGIMIHRFPAIALLAIGATSLTRNRLYHPVFRQKPFTARKQRTSSCAGEERALSLCSFTDMRRTATPGLLWPQVAGSAGHVAESRLTPAEYEFPQHGNPGTG